MPFPCLNPPYPPYPPYPPFLPYFFISSIPRAFIGFVADTPMPKARYELLATPTTPPLLPQTKDLAIITLLILPKVQARLKL